MDFPSVPRPRREDRVVDVRANRRMRNWSAAELGRRILWALIRPLFAWSPRIFWGWRRALLRLFGARVGHEVHIYPSVRISIPWNLTVGDQAAIGDRAILYALGEIVIAERVTVSQGAHLCAGTHDYRDPTMPLLKLPIAIGSDAWVCADAFVGPGVQVGARAIVGARCVVMKDVEPDAIMIGNPARPLGWRIARTS
jgi:putative colanic acid biosynthesis acetyltransferase WcaF